MKRLLIEHNFEITPEKLFLNMFVSYTIEQRTSWFYPFVIRKRELKGMTGYDEYEIKRKIDEL